tara:strand:+ start:1873 stop:2082 length:210 start_codon:yes stop_codon:yes gene_type:complete
VARVEVGRVVVRVEAARVAVGRVVVRVEAARVEAVRAPQEAADLRVRQHAGEHDALRRAQPDNVSRHSE